VRERDLAYCIHRVVDKRERERERKRDKERDRERKREKERDLADGTHRVVDKKRGSEQGEGKDDTVVFCASLH